MAKPQNVYMPIDAFCGRVFSVSEGAERSQWVSKFALALAGTGSEPFAKELLEKAAADMVGSAARQARYRAKRKQQNLEVLANPALPGTSSGNGEALNDEAATAPAGQHFEEARTPSAATTPVPVPAHGNAAEGGLLTPWYGPEAGETLDNGRRLPATTRADAHAREDLDASATVRAQNLDGDAPQGDLGEAGASGFATSPSTFPRRPGKSAQSTGVLVASGGSERGAGGVSGAVRRSPGAKVAEPKLRYGSAGNVLMTATEMAKLASEFGDVRQITEELSDYLLLHPNKYRSHYAALRNWCRRRSREGRNPDGTRMTQGDRLARYFAEREQEIIHGHRQDQ